MLRLFGPECSPAPADAENLKAIPKTAAWVDLLDPTDAERAIAEAALGHPIPTRDELVEIEPSSRLYERDRAIFMTASVLHGFADNQPNSDPIGFILTRERLFTVRHIDPKPFSSFAEQLYSGVEAPGSALGILVRLLDAIVDRLADEIEATAREIERTSARVFEHRGHGGRSGRRVEMRLEALLMRLGKIQRMLAEIRDSGLSTERLLGFLASSHLTRDSEEADHVEILKGDVQGLLDHSDFLVDNLTFLLDASLGLINLEQNTVMKLFSIIAVVLMPPTLVAGVYGMNFRYMPELDWAAGYPIALGLILVSAVVPYLIARRSGWL